MESLKAEITGCNPGSSSLPATISPVLLPYSRGGAVAQMKEKERAYLMEKEKCFIVGFAFVVNSRKKKKIIVWNCIVAFVFVLVFSFFYVFMGSM